MLIPVNGITMYVETVGSGPPLLLLHGFTGSADNWKPFVRSWSTKYRLIMVDIIGHGRSSCPGDPARYAIDRAAADMIGILDHFGIERCNVLGYSMGGRLALTLAVRYPERLAALIVESSSPGLADRKEREERVQRDEHLARRLERDGIERFVDYWESIPLFATQKKLPASVRERIRSGRLKNSVTGLANSLRGMGTGAQPSLWHELNDLHVPVLLMTGELDDKFFRIAADMHERLPCAQWRQVAGAGHTIHVEQASVFDTIVVDYLRGMMDK